jgi:putative glycosyltransferase
MKLSIVTTLYKSRIFLEEFISATLETVAKLDIVDYEILFVNDGSPDDSLNYLLETKKIYPQIKIIDLSRNFGHHYAMQVGLKYALGEYIFLIDNDLEVHPRFLIDCYDELNRNKELDVVYGYQENRKGNLIENIGGSIFWNILNKISDIEIPKNMLTERLMRKQFVDSLLTLRDYNLFLGGMMHWVGFNQKGLLVNKQIRTGNSTYNLKRRAELMIDALTSFSGKPLQYLFYLGLFITASSFLMIVYIAAKKIIYGNTIQLGWSSIVAVNVLILGIISTFLGLIGIYIFKIYKQVQNRPNAIIKSIY